jgi:hypothetical protein
LNEYYAQESTEPVQSKQKKTKLQEMNDFNLRRQMIRKPGFVILLPRDINILNFCIILIVVRD